jgi:PAS domain S-box-containing protein
MKPSKKALSEELIELRMRISELEARIREDVQTEKVLQNPAEVTRMMLENANDAIYVVQDGFFKFVNSKTIEVTGYTAAELMAEPAMNFVHPDDREIIYDRYQRRFQGENITNLYPHRILDKKGNVKWIEVNTVLITWQGRRAQLSFMKDITEEKRVEDALKQSERLLSDIINFLPDSTFAIDNAGQVIAWNRAIETLTGIASRDMIGKGDYEYAQAFYGQRMPILIDKILHPPIAVAERYLSYGSEKDFLLAEAEIVQNGQNITFWCKAGPMYDHEGKIIGAIESLKDITSLKEMNAALKVLLRQREQDGKEIEERFLLNIKELILPHVIKLKAANLDVNLAARVDIIESNLNSITSPFLVNLTSKYSHLTPREIQVTSLIKDGLRTKEIAYSLNISTHSVDIYRQNIRKKLGLNNKKINMRSFFISLK